MASSCKEFAYNEECNAMFRPYMEDTIFTEDNFGGDSTCGLFAVFDGHGGKTVSEYIWEWVPEELRKTLKMKKPSDLVQVFEDVFVKVDSELRLMDAENTGSTGCVGLLRMESGHWVLYIANVGDTRAVISWNGVAERMSVDHKCDDPNEVEWIRKAGGIVIEQWVGGSLAVSRAFGDYSLKSEGVIAVPYVRKHFVWPFDKFLVVATDGVWDVLTDQDAVDYCKEDKTTDEISKTLIK